jgi:hypothetical protein
MSKNTRPLIRTFCEAVDRWLLCDNLGGTSGVRRGRRRLLEDRTAGRLRIRLGQPPRSFNAASGDGSAQLDLKHIRA